MHVAEIPELKIDFWHALMADGKSRATADAYCHAVKLVHEWAVEQGHEVLDPRLLHQYFAYLRTVDARGGHNYEHKPTGRKLSPAYIVHLQTGLRSFFRWAYEEEYCEEADMMRKIRRPKIAEKPIPVLTEKELTAIVDACKAKRTDTGYVRLAAIRDTAMFRLLIDCGVRRMELAEIRLQDIDFDTRLVTITGKGGKVRQVPFGSKTFAALRKYIWFRDRYPKAAGTAKLFVTMHGPMTKEGVSHVIHDRCRKANLGHIHPHQFRHTLAHRWLKEGLDGTALMRIMGWSSPAMLHVYGRSGTTERALHVAREAGLGDKI